MTDTEFAQITEALDTFDETREYLELWKADGKYDPYELAFACSLVSDWMAVFERAQEIAVSVEWKEEATFGGLADSHRPLLAECAAEGLIP